MTAPAHYTGASNFGPNVLTTVYLQKIFEEANKKKRIALPLGKEAQLPENMGKTVRWNRMVMPGTLSAVSEDTPTTVTLTTATVTATLLDYSATYPYSRFLELTAIEDTIPEIVSTAGYQVSLTADTICYSSALTNHTQISGGVAMTAEVLRSTVSTLDGLDAIPNPVAEALGGKYCATFSPEQAYDMMGEGAPTWWQAKNLQVEPTFKTPWDGTPASAMLYNTFIKTSTVITTQSSASNEFAYVIGGADFGTVFLGPGDPRSPRVIITTPEQRVDRAGRDQGTIGTWFLFAAALLNDNNGREISTAIT